MTEKIIPVPEKSSFLQELLEEFIEAISKDETIEAHTLEALRNHFKDKTFVTPTELKAILAITSEAV